MWREGGGLEKLSGGHGRGGGEEEEEGEEGRRKENGRRWKRMWRREEGVIAD